MAESHPDGVLEATRRLQFVCPLCKGPLTISDAAYSCSGCEREYRVEAGIPDFRVFDDPYLDRESDRERTAIVVEALDRMSLRELLEYYWSFSDTTPAHLRKKFVDSGLRGEDRGRRLIGLILSSRLSSDGDTNGSAERLLEIGCGTGGLLSEASGQFNEVVGVDIAMRWLHVSRRRFIDRGIPVPPLVCCCAEYLPFAPKQFDVVAMASTLEFVGDPGAALMEVARVLDASGRAIINAVNRHSLAANPYVDLWGVGFLPATWQVRYVRWRRDTPFNVRPFSRSDIGAIAADAFEQCEVGLADIDDSAIASLPSHLRASIVGYRIAKRTPIVRHLLSWITPEWDIVLRGPKPGSPGLGPLFGN